MQWRAGMFKKMWRGGVQLLRMHGPGAPLPDASAAAALHGLLPLASSQLPRSIPLPARALWDVASAVHALRAPREGSQGTKPRARRSMKRR